MATQRKTSFAAEFELAQGLAERRTPRAPVALDVGIGRGGLDRALCKVIDVSVHGARLQTYSELRAGEMIWLALPNLGYRAARVIWVHDFEAGLEFKAPLSKAHFQKLTA